MRFGSPLLNVWQATHRRLAISLPLAALALASSGPIGSGPVGAAAAVTAACFTPATMYAGLANSSGLISALAMKPVTIARIMAPSNAPRILFISKDIDQPSACFLHVSRAGH